MLARRSGRVDGMAYSGRVYAWNALGTMARDRVCLLSRNRISLLVAGCSTMAECLATAQLVDHPVPLPGDVAVRCPFRISCLLRTRRVSRVPFDIGPIQLFRSRRSAVRRCVNVDVRHSCVSRGWSNSQHTPALAADFRGNREARIDLSLVR